VPSRLVLLAGLRSGCLYTAALPGGHVWLGTILEIGRGVHEHAAGILCTDGQEGTAALCSGIVRGLVGPSRMHALPSRPISESRRLDCLRRLLTQHVLPGGCLRPVDMSRRHLLWARLDRSIGLHDRTPTDRRAVPVTSSSLHLSVHVARRLCASFRCGSVLRIDRGLEARRRVCSVYFGSWRRVQHVPFATSRRASSHTMRSWLAELAGSRGAGCTPCQCVGFMAYVVGAICSKRVVSGRPPQ